MTTNNNESKAAMYKSAFLTRSEYSNYVRLISFDWDSQSYEVQMIGGERSIASINELSEFCL